MLQERLGGKNSNKIINDEPLHATGKVVLIGKPETSIIVSIIMIVEKHLIQSGLVASTDGCFALLIRFYHSNY
ncbi:MAG TPA: hypothetical protein VH796_15225 [Nitrososphaeraceae archaeon]|jgi:hypothetical protein